LLRLLRIREVKYNKVSFRRKPESSLVVEKIIMRLDSGFHRYAVAPE
jgi:hypothetical protein